MLTEWIHSLSLTLHDEKVLSTAACLTDNHISAAEKLLKIQFPNHNGLQDTAYLQQKLIWNSQLNDFMQIIYIDPHHWACVSNVFCTEENEVDLYDSLHTTPSADGSIVQQVSIIVGTKCFKINLMNVCLQFGSTDCGLFAIAMATHLVNRTDPCSVYYTQPLMRDHLKRCFEEQSLTPFPNHPRNIERRVLCTFTVDINGDHARLSKSTRKLTFLTNCLVVFINTDLNVILTGSRAKRTKGQAVTMEHTDGKSGKLQFYLIYTCYVCARHLFLSTGISMQTLMTICWCLVKELSHDLLMVGVF